MHQEKTWRFLLSSYKVSGRYDFGNWGDTSCIRVFRIFDERSWTSWRQYWWLVDDGGLRDHTLATICTSGINALILNRGCLEHTSFGHGIAE